MIEVRGLRVPADDLRVPRVVAVVQLGPVAATVTVRRRRGGGLMATWPAADDRQGPAVVLAAELRQAAEAAAVAAVRADSLAARYLGLRPMPGSFATTTRTGAREMAGVTPRPENSAGRDGKPSRNDG